MSGGTIAGAGLSLGSTLANSMAQGKIDAARQQVLTDQQARQSALDSQIQGKNADALSGYANIGSGTAAQQAGLASLYGSNVAGTSASSAPNIMPVTNSGAAQASAGAALAAKGAYGAQQGSALATMQAPGQAMTQAGIERLHDAQSIAQLNNFKSGTAATLPMQLDAANQSGTSLKTLGDLLRGGAAIGYGQGAPGTAAWLSGGGLSSYAPAFTGSIGNAIFPSF